MGVLKNEVGRPTNKTILVRNILKRILVVIVAAGIFAGGYYYNDKISNNTITMEQANEMLEKFNSHIEFGYFYEKDRNVNNLDNNIILITALNSMVHYGNETFTKNDVKKIVNQIFGNINYKDESVSSYCGEYIYDNKKKIYKAEAGCGSDTPYIKSEIIDVKSSFTKLII